MRSTFSSLEIAKRALQAQRMALDVTGHNIANANTLGYSRQVAQLQATKPTTMAEWHTAVNMPQVGTGVEVGAISRLRDQFLDFQFRNESQARGNWEEQALLLGRLETIYNEPSDTGLRQSLDDFFSAWQELSKEPQSATTRAIVREQSLALADTFNQIKALLQQSQDNVEFSLGAIVQEANALGIHLARLNAQIATAQLSGHQPNDLLDQRDALIDQLSVLGQVKVTEMERENHIDRWRISLVGKDEAGNPQEWVLVEDRTAHEIIKQTIDGQIIYQALNHEGQMVDLNASIGGRLQGLMTGMETLAAYKSSLDDLVQGLVVAINIQHQEGYDQNGDAGQGFFVVDTTSQEGYVKLNEALLGPGSLLKIAASVSNTVVDGDNALAIAQLRDGLAALNTHHPKWLALGDSLRQAFEAGTFHDHYNALVAKLGIDSREAQRMVINQDRLLIQIDNARLSVMGVSLDEEMANMIRFQHAYNAAARMVTAVDEMIDQIVNRMGLVGR